MEEMLLGRLSRVERRLMWESLVSHCKGRERRLLVENISFRKQREHLLMLSDYPPSV